MILTCFVYSVPDVSKNEAVADRNVGANVLSTGFLVVFRLGDKNEPPPKPSVTSNNVIVSKTLSSDEFNKCYSRK